MYGLCVFRPSICTEADIVSECKFSLPMTSDPRISRLVLAWPHWEEVTNGPSKEQLEWREVEVFDGGVPVL